MTIIPFLELDTQNVETNAVNEYQQFDWETFDFTVDEQYVAKDDGIYISHASEKEKYHKYKYIKYDKGVELIYDDSVYKATEDMDRSPENQDTIDLNYQGVPVCFTPPPLYQLYAKRNRIAYDLIVPRPPSTNVADLALTAVDPSGRYTMKYFETDTDAEQIIYHDSYLPTDALDGMYIYKRKILKFSNKTATSYTTPAGTIKNHYVYDIDYTVEYYDSSYNLTGSSTTNYGTGKLSTGYEDMLADDDYPIFLDQQHTFIRVGDAIYYIYGKHPMPTPDVQPLTPPYSRYKKVDTLLSFYSALPKDIPFDDKSYTMAYAAGDIHFNNISPIGAYDCIVLSGIIGDELEVQCGGQTYTGSVPLTKEGKTYIIHVPQQSGTISVKITNTVGDYAKIGLIAAGNKVDLGITEFNTTQTMRDTSPYKTLAGGVVDYIPGITLFDVDVTSKGDIADIDKFKDVIRDSKKRRMGFDLGDSWVSDTPSDVQKSLWMVGRIDKASISTSTNGSELSKVTSASFNILEAS